MSLTAEIKNYALDIGYHAVGVTTAEPFELYAQVLSERSADYDWTLDHVSRLRRAIDPHDRLPGARAIVVAVYDYFREDFPPEMVGKIARVYQARCYGASPKRIAGARVELMRQYLEARGMQVGKWFGVSSGAPDRLAAARAGVAQGGRNTFAAAPGIGSFCVINCYIVDTELEYDRPTMDSHCPPNCRACLDACPAQAIIADYRLSPRRCIAFNNLANLEAPPFRSGYIDHGIRAKMGSWVYGCDVCQEACPRNQSKLKAKLPANPFLTAAAQHFSFAGLLEMSAESQMAIVEPFMTNYGIDARYLRRNAAIALGNSGDPSAVPALRRALIGTDEIVRAHAAWALGRLGGSAARSALEAALPRETADRARHDIADALAAC